jgi:hypothetical protein
VANKEQLVSFVAITIITIVLMSLLAYSTVLGAEGENNISFLEAEGNALMDKVGTWFGYLFWFIGATSLFAAALGIVDYTCRLVADVLKVSCLRDNDTWSESRIYFPLILTNKRSLPPSVRIGGFRTATMVWSVLLFGFASVVAVQAQWDNLKELLGL